ELLDQFLVALDDTRSAFDLRLAVKNPSGVCSSVQKLKSRFVRRIFSSCEVGAGSIWTGGCCQVLLAHGPKGCTIVCTNPSSLSLGAQMRKSLFLLAVATMLAGSARADDATVHSVAVGGSGREPCSSWTKDRSGDSEQAKKSAEIRL